MLIQSNIQSSDLFSLLQDPHRLSANHCSPKQNKVTKQVGFKMTGVKTHKNGLASYSLGFPVRALYPVVFAMILYPITLCQDECVENQKIDKITSNLVC